MKIVNLQAENIKRIVAVEITPDGHVVVVGGANAAGKSSVLDGIMYTLRGKSLIPDEPLRRGTKKGHFTIKLDGEEPLTVKRIFGAKGTSSLKVTAADGSSPASPQALLDSLCGRIAFDPLEFTRQPPAKQVETLRELVGLDFTEHDAKRLKLFADRTVVNRDVKSTEAKLDSAPQHGGTPEEEVSVINLTKELSLAQATNTAKEEACSKVRDGAGQTLLAAKEVQRTAHNVKLAQDELKKDEVEHAAAVEAKGACDKEVDKLKMKADALIADECQPILDRIAKSDEVNSKIRANAERKRLANELAGLCGKADTLTGQLERLDEDKQQALESAEWPIEGLGFGDDGVTFSDLPFEQASSAEQLRISVAVGLALNPKLRVLLIRDGSLLDENNLATIGKMAEEADAQVWIERVGEGTECAVIIEDGRVKEEEPDDADE